MSDSTKKSIVINKAFLSGGDSSSSLHTQNKKSKKNTRIFSEEIVKPNKLKKMLLDKINAKRKAEQTSSVTSMSDGSKADTLDISKETKIFSSEFKKSLDFLDSYIGQKRNEKNNKNNNNKTKTLKKQGPSVSTSLNNDILKSLHSNSITQNTSVPTTHATRASNSINQSLPPQGYVAQPIVSRPPQHIPAPIAAPLHRPQHRPQHSPLFQKIELQIPNKPTQSVSPNILPDAVPKINLAIGKPVNSAFVYTELPPELQNFTPPVYNISSPSLSSLTAVDVPPTIDSLPALDSYHKPIDVIDSRDNMKIDVNNNNNSELLDVGFGMKNEMNGGTIETDGLGLDVELSNTSLLPTSTTFSPIKLSDDAPYGCLKGGKKPTFRMYNKTIKNNLRFSSNDGTYSDRQTKLKELQNKHSNKKTFFENDGGSKNNDNDNDNDNHNDNHNDNDNDNENDNYNDNNNNNNDDKKSRNMRRTKIRKKFRKTITKKFKLGKQPGTNIVGVLIKNNDTRKNIQKEHGLLKSKQLGEVKKYLVEKNLIKIGSTAPPGVIRNIYEASMLSGEVENIGKGIGLHNFLEDRKVW
jgi:hypothetical protein